MTYLLHLGIITTLHLVTTSDINIALGKPARQSLRFADRPAVFAVDGNLNAHYPYCTHTQRKPPGKPNWWMVNLGARYKVHRVAIRNRSDLGERLNNFLLTVWEVDPAPLIKDNMEETYCTCLHYPGALPSYGLINLPCSTNCTGQFVAVILPSDYLTLCEVQVYGQLQEYHQRKDALLRVIKRKRATTSTIDQTIYPVQSKNGCSKYCLSNDNCLGINYVYNETSSSGVCQMLMSITNPLNNIIDDENSTWLVIRQITFA